jgi:FixJ family two-component response regulator
MSVSAATSCVYLIDDDDLILSLHAELLGTLGFEVRSFHGSRAFLACYVRGPCECILCDLRMPEVDGLQLQEQLLARGIDTPIIFITGHADVATAVEAMRRGAFDYVEKPVHARHLQERVNAALARSAELQRVRREHLARQARLAALTAQERRIAEWVVQGKSSRDISELAAISVRTVENHRARIMDKLSVGSVAELVRILL